MEVPAVQPRRAGEHDEEAGEDQAEDGEGEEERRDELVQEVFDCCHAAPHLQAGVDSLAEVALQRPVSVSATVWVARDTAGVRVGAIEVRLPVPVATGAEDSAALVPGLQAVPHPHHGRVLGSEAQCPHNVHLVQLVVNVGLHQEAEDHGNEDYDEN